MEKTQRFILPLDEIEISDGEMLLIRGGFSSMSGEGYGCGCGCECNNGRGCDCKGGNGCGCGCAKPEPADKPVTG